VTNTKNNEKYRDMIKGRSVVFVGACPNIKGLGYGQFIDDFDVVVKSNGSVLMQPDEKYKNDYGSRIDVLYCNNQFQREMKPFNLSFFASQGVRSLNFKNIGEPCKSEYSKYMLVRDVSRIVKHVQRHCHSAAYGPVIYTDILQFKPAELFITGVDFFASKKASFEHDNYQEYLDGYLPPKIRTIGNAINRGKTKDGHSFTGNAKYIKSLFDTHRNLKTHDFIYKLLEDIVHGRVSQR